MARVRKDMGQTGRMRASYRGPNKLARVRKDTGQTGRSDARRGYRGPNKLARVRTYGHGRILCFPSIFFPTLLWLRDLF